MQDNIVDAAVAPVQYEEKDVADFLHIVWMFVLETPDVPRDVSFFDLGGRSLQMMVVINQLRTRFGCEISPLNFAMTPTIETLARQCCTPLDSEEYL